MQARLIFLFVFITTFCFAQDSTKELIVKKIPVPGYEWDIYIENPTKQVMSYEIVFDVTSYKADRPLEIKDTIAAGVTKKIMHLNRSKKADRSFSYKWTESVGNIFTKHNFSMRYTLPYAEQETYEVLQGYDEGETHTTTEALDFNLPENTPVRVMRRGLVVGVQDEANLSSISPCSKKSNFVRVLHYDGTFASYRNLKHQTFNVKSGDYVNIGDILAHSDKGYLHVQVEKLQSNLKGYVTIPVKFTISPEGETALLERGDKVTRPNNIQ